ncbi:hypothetical protein RU639_011673 [Aspergillus parasiticus]
MALTCALNHEKGALVDYLFVNTFRGAWMSRGSCMAPLPRTHAYIVSRSGIIRYWVSTLFGVQCARLGISHHDSRQPTLLHNNESLARLRSPRASGLR